MDDGSPALIILLVVLIILSCIFSIAESSFLGMNRLRLRILRDKKNKKALRVGRLLDRKERLINTLLVANDIVNVLISSLITAVALKLFGAKGVGIATVVATILLLIFGEITPKTISTRCPDRIAYALSGIITVFCFILHPVIVIVTCISRGILRLCGIKPEKSSQAYTEEEMKTFFDMGAENGVLEETENTMMNKVFKFTDLEAQDVMVPRTKITSINLASTFNDILELSERTGFNRFPVCREENSIDDIVGVVYLKDLLDYKKNKDSFSVSAVMRDPIFIPGTKKMSALQSVLYEHRQSMAIVVDEYSGTDGILTDRDIQREIFGIKNEKTLRGKVFDFDTLENPEDFEINGSVLLLDLSEALHIKLVSTINETVAGWFIEHLDRMPFVGDVVEFSGYRFTVKKVQAHRIERMRIEKLAVSEDADLEDEE